MKRFVFLSSAVLIFIGIALFFIPTILKKANHINDKEIVLGQSCALSGPAEDLGLNMMKGATAYFRYINDNGGVHGRTIALKTLDDKYEPFYAVQNTKKFLDEDHVFALFGEVGTPTSLAVTPLSKEKGVPFLTPFTGAEFLRSPFESTFINLRASYYMETAALVDYLTGIGIARISVFYQNDGYGKAGYEGVVRALDAKGLSVHSEGRYRRNTLAYFDALNMIKMSAPGAVIMIGAYKPCAEFIKTAKASGMENVKFCNISFVGSQALIKRLDGDEKNVIISQVVPLPWDSTHPAVAEYQKIFRHYYPDESFGFVSLEGFLSAKLVTKALKKAGQKLTRENFINAFESLPSDSLDGFTLSLTGKNHQALENVYITDFHDGKFHQIKAIHNAQ